MSTNSAIEQSVNIKPFMKEAEAILNRCCESDEDSESENDYQKHQTYEQKEIMYNKDIFDKERKKLYNILLSDTETESEISDEDRYVNQMLKDHVREKKYRAKYHQSPSVSKSYI